MKGLASPRDERTGRLPLRRAGPFAPPIIFTRDPGVGYVVLVTEALRQKLLAAGFGDLEFQPTTRQRIVNIPWQTWDRHARLPAAMLPESGEPEDYILRGNHSEETASEMGEIWEFIAPVAQFEIRKSERLAPFSYRREISRPEGPIRGLFRRPGKGHLLFVDQPTRQWFEQEAGEWIEFDEVFVI